MSQPNTEMSVRERASEEVARAMHFIQFGTEPTEPLREKGGVLDPRGVTYKLAVTAVETMQREGWHHA